MCRAWARHRSFDREDGRRGDAQNLAASTIEAAGDPQWIDELDTDQAERLLATETTGEE